jgi:glycosyltransferase involved in cell wall biosynthesis
VIVDDCSADTSPEIAKDFAERDQRVIYIQQAKNGGKTAALRAGFEVTKGEIVIIQDADLEYDPREIADVIAPILEHRADVVYGSRFSVKRAARVLYFSHYLANKGLTFLSNVLTNLNMSDIETCYKAFRGDIIRNLVITSHGFGFEVEVTAKIAKLKCAVYEVPISYYGRTYEEGKKIGLKDGIAAVWYISKFNLLVGVERSFHSLPQSRAVINDPSFLIPMINGPTYVGKDLEAMSFAVNYHRWILDEFRPFLGNRFVEVGAGTGDFSKLLVGEDPETLAVVEPSEMFVQLENELSAIESKTEITFYRSIYANVHDIIANESRPDSIFYVNVLEHIENDVGELRLVHESLGSGGRCFVFVPALMSLYGGFDRKIGHFRRYSKSELEEKCSAAGLRVVKSKYFDLVGIIPWWLKYRLLGSDDLGSRSVSLYDSFAVPLTKRLESLTEPSVGKNILAIAEK